MFKKPEPPGAPGRGHDAPSTTGVRMGVMGNNEVSLVVGAQ